MRTISKRANGTDPFANLFDLQREELTVHVGSHTEEMALPVNLLVVDETYQRSIDWPWVRYIARTWDPAKFEKPEVIPRPDGRYAVINGQQRIEALKIRFPGKRITVLCDVRTDITTLQEEAGRFKSTNFDKKKLRSDHLLKALIAEDDADAVAFVHILRGAGYRPKFGGGRTQPGEIHAGAFELAKRNGGSTWQRDLRATMETCAEAWGTTTFPISATLIGGLVIFYHKYGDFPSLDWHRFAERLQKMTPMAVDALGRSRAAMERKNNPTGMMMFLRTTYNKGLQRDDHRLPE